MKAETSAAPDPVTLEEMLSARDRRWELQETLLQAHGKTLLSYTLNIAGPQKRYDLADQCFFEGRRLIERQFLRDKLCPLDAVFTDEKTGFALIWVIDSPPRELKAKMGAIEEGHPLGRVFDIDVIAADGRRVSREEIGLPQRACVVCGAPGAGCARSRAHPHEEVAAGLDRLMAAYFDQKYVDLVAKNAVRALLYEVAVTPKPGLVDRANSGAHSDMDFFDFIDSAAALSAYFRDMAATGLQSRGDSPGDLLPRLRFRGICAEDEMFAATGGVNTHKGLIFSLGTLSAAYGWHGARYPAAEAVLRTAGEIAAPALSGDLRGITQENAVTHGELIFAKYGLAGIRREAAAGFPAVRKLGLPRLRAGTASGLSLNDAGALALLSFLAETTDTNIISRAGLEKLEEIQAALTGFLESGPGDSEALAHAACLDRAFIREHISPGGCADLLALTFMAYFMERERD